jgi:hypothetical protein
MPCGTTRRSGDAGAWLVCSLSMPLSSCASCMRCSHVRTGSCTSSSMRRWSMVSAVSASSLMRLSASTRGQDQAAAAAQQQGSSSVEASKWQSSGKAAAYGVEQHSIASKAWSSASKQQERLLLHAADHGAAHISAPCR